MTHSNHKKDMFSNTIQTSNKSIYQPNPQKIEPKIKKIYSSYCEADSSKQQVKLLWKLIKLCHNNTIGQSCLAKILSLPQKNGPISINPLPRNLLEHNQEIGLTVDGKTTQLEFLFDFLKNIEENYFCWIIYYSEELNVLNLKLLRQDQLPQFEELFNPNLNLIGIFTAKQKQKTKIQTSSNKRQLQSEFNEEIITLSKTHTKSTPNNSTGSSWKNPLQQISQTNVRISQFKFRSISPKFKIASKVRMLKKANNDYEKSNKSLSVTSKVGKNSKSQSIFHKVNITNDNNKMSSTYLQQNKQIPPKMQKKVMGSTKLKKESKLHRVQRAYKKAT